MLRRWGGNIFVDLSLLVYPDNTKLHEQFNVLKNVNNKIIQWLTVQIFYNLQNRPAFHSEERLVNNVRGRECFVSLSIFSVYASTCAGWPGKGGAGAAGLQLLWDADWGTRSPGMVRVEATGLWRPILPHFTHRKESDIREGKGRRCCLGDILECRISHFAARMIWRQIFKRTSILGGWWFGVMWTGWSLIFLKHPFRQVFVLPFFLFFKSSWC